jgi:hypothetical protein
MTKIHTNHSKAIPCQFGGRFLLSFIIAQSRPGTDLTIKQTLRLTGSSQAGYQNPLLSGHGRR